MGGLITFIITTALSGLIMAAFMMWNYKDPRPRGSAHTLAVFGILIFAFLGTRAGIIIGYQFQDSYAQGPLYGSISGFFGSLFGSFIGIGIGIYKNKSKNSVKNTRLLDKEEE